MSKVAKFIGGAVLVGAGVVVGLGSMGFGSPLALSLLSTGAQLITAGLFGLPEFQSGIKTNVTSTQAGLPVVYGKAKIGHANADVRTDPENSDFLIMVGAICVGSENGAGIHSIDLIEFGNRTAVNVTAESFPSNNPPLNTNVDSFWRDEDGNSLYWYNLHPGSDSQAVDPFLNDRVATAWPSTSTGKGIAYAVHYLAWDQTEKGTWSGIPQVTYTLRGNLVYDPRDITGGPNSDGWIYDKADSGYTFVSADANNPGQNPSLVLYDYLTSKRYGLGLDSTLLDETSFTDQADHCDESVTLAGVTGSPTQARYTLNGAILTSDSHKDNIEKILSSMNANLLWKNGKVSVMPRKSQTPEAFELTDDVILGGISISRSGSGTPNTVRAKFPDEENDYNVLDVAWPEPGTNVFLDADNGIESELEIDLPLTTNYHTAQHLAQLALRELRQDVSVELTATEDAMILQPGEVVRLTYDSAGWTQKEFRVMNMKLKDDSTVGIQLREYDSSVYNLNESDAPTVPGTDLPDPFVVVPPTNVTITCSIPIETTYGAIIPGVQVSWTHTTDKFARWEEPVYKEFTAVDWIHTGRRVLMNDDPTAILTGPFEIGKTYHFAVIAYNNLGRASDKAVGPSCQITPPDDPDNPNAGDAIILNCEWADDGTYWATEAGSTGVATNTTTVSTGVDFVFDANGEVITLAQVVDTSTDITKTVTL